MANPEHVAVAKVGNDSIKAWRNDNPDTVLDLSRASFQGDNLSDVDLSEANLSWADLRETRFRNSNLSWAELRGADLTDADLTGAKLTDTDFCRAKLIRAKLTGSDLFGANLSEANLSEADFRGASLRRVDFSGADFTSTEISNARFGFTRIGDVDFSSAIGLENVLHRFASSIGVDTIYASCGNIPNSFLRGCGIPEDFITYLPSLLNEPIQFYSVFISYSHNDKAFAQRLYDTLQGKGIRCWKDDHQLLPGDDVRTAIDDGIKIYDKVLLCASKDSLNSNWCDKEIRKAFSKEERLNSKPSDNIRALIPLNLDGYLFDDEWQSPYATDLRERFAPDFRNWKNNHDKFEREVENVIKALALNDRLREPPPKPLL